MNRVKFLGLALLFLPLQWLGAQTLEAAFEVLPDSEFPNTGAVIVNNLSVGTYQYVSIEMGNGAVLNSTSPSINYAYEDFGVYVVTLTVWSATETSTITHEIVVAGADLCAGMDCVWPGDANQDGVADFNDILQIGTAYGQQGPVRVGANLDWVGQPALDWGLTTYSGADYKHLDTDGDGVITAFDFAAIVEENYTPLTGTPVSVESGAPLLSISFDLDTLEVSSGNIYEVNAEVFLGTNADPATLFYGLAYRVDIPTALAPFVQSVTFDYNPSSFLGSELTVLSTSKFAGSQTDVALCRQDGLNANGAGKIGDMTFIIIGDIIDGRQEGVIDLPIQLASVSAIDAAGQPKFVSAFEAPSNITFVSSVVSSKDALGQKWLRVLPNPAQTFLTIEAEGTMLLDLQLIDGLGRSCLQIAPNSASTTLDISGFSKGVYMLRVLSENGEMAVRKVVVE